MQSKREWTQCEMQLSPGAEPWVRIRHRNGVFLLPADASVAELLEGVQRGWKGRRRSATIAATVRVPLELYLDLWNKAGRSSAQLHSAVRRASRTD